MPWVSLACGRPKGCLDFSPFFFRGENRGPHIMKRLVQGPRRVNYTCFLTREFICSPIQL